MAWALLVPPGQSPDEPSHVAYAQTLAERGERPEPDDVAGRVRAFSTEQQLARERSHWEWAIAEPRVRPEWRTSVFRRWQREQGRLPSAARENGGGPNSASGNPPLYYGYVAVAYHAAGGSSFFARYYAMRIASALLLLVAVAATWLLVGELTGRDRLLQLAGAACVGLQPMASFISASVNPDGALIAVWALVFWLGVRLVRGEATALSACLLIGATLLALLTKASSFALLPAVGLVLAVAARRTMRGRQIGLARLAPFAVAGIAVVVVAAVAGSERLGDSLQGGPGDLRAFASYLWQAYLPNLPFQERIPNLAAFHGYDIWVRSSWGAFGWLEVLLPRPVHALLALLSLVVAAGAIAAVARGRLALDRVAIAFFALAGVALVAGLHWAEYRQFVEQDQAFIQGRYLLPLLPVAGVGVAAALANLVPARRAIPVALLLAGLFVLELFSLGMVAARFYA